MIDAYIEPHSRETKFLRLKGIIKGNIIELEKNLMDFGFKQKKEVLLRIDNRGNPYESLYGILNKPVSDEELKEAKKLLTKNAEVCA